MSDRFGKVVSALVLALAAGMVTLAQAPPPGAPANLTYQVSGGSVWLNWISSAGMTPTFSPTSSFYRLEAGATPGTTFFTWDSSSLGDTPDSRKMFYMLTSFATGGVAPGNYYVRVRGVNNGVVGPPSNEVLVPITGGCQAPGAPTDFTGITRGTNVYMAWNDGNGGLPTSYMVHARYQPGGPIIAALGTNRPPAVGTEPPTGGYLNVGAVPPGAYYVQVFAANACGTSPYSNEILVNAPNNGPAVRTPDAASGKLPWFQIRDLVTQIGNEARALGYLNGTRGVNNDSCQARPNFPFTTNPNDPILELQKTQRNRYIDYVVAQLRARFDPRIGYNAKVTRANAIVAGDEIAYHWGSDAAEGSPSAYFIDVLGGHCTFGNETVDYRPFFIEYGRWTAAGAF
jgi:hypothetical protein